VSWKHDLQLSDLDDTTRIEATCKKCGHSHYETRISLAGREELSQAYLIEVEKALRCGNRFCKGPVRIALIHNGKLEGFVGGMA
jgi:hypothetical protein